MLIITGIHVPVVIYSFIRTQSFHAYTLDLIGIRNSSYGVRLGIEWDDDGVRIRLGVEAFLGSYVAF